jgi:UDP-glucose 4-epimerase
MLPPAHVVIGDASDPEIVEDVTRDVDHVVWCGGGLLPAESVADPIADVLAALPPLLTTLATLARRPGTGVTFFSSGGTVYGNPTALPVDEDQPLQPLSSYGITKVTAEQYLSLYTELHGVPSHVLRCSNVYGAGQPANRSQGLVAAALEHARTGRRLPVFGDGSAVRDYIHIDDVTRVVMALLGRRDVPRVLNVGSGVGVSVTQVLKTVEQVTGRRVQVDRRAPRPGDVRQIVLDTTRVQALAPFEPVPLPAGIARTWAAPSQVDSSSAGNADGSETRPRNSFR